MHFLSQACVDHGGASTDPSAVCCPGFTKWPYDANTGGAYDGFMCWSANCAAEGQFSYQGAGCCAGLVSVNGKCAQPAQQQQNPPSCAVVGKTPLANQVCCSGLQKDSQGICNIPSNTPGSCAGTIVCSIPDMYLYGGVGVIILLMAMGGKRR